MELVAVKVQQRMKREAQERGELIGAVSVMDDKERKRKALNAKKQERARIRRAQKVLRSKNETPEQQAKKWGWSKPLPDWDAEELAHGYPRNNEGKFTRVRPAVVPRAVYEEAISRFRDLTTQDMRVLVPDAIALVHSLIVNDAIDAHGKMVVPPSVRLEAAKWVVEHLVGKPVQPVDVDISVKLQGILANVMVSPEEMARRRNQGYIPAIGRDLVGDEEAAG